MRKHTILIVDDDFEMRLALQIRLKANNFEIVCAVDGVSAISETKRVMPDLILLDLGLPAGDGFTVLERLKGNSALSSIPVLVVSGRDKLLNGGRAEALGATLFLQKPVRNSELLQAIQRTLGSPTSAHSVVYDISRQISGND